MSVDTDGVTCFPVWVLRGEFNPADREVLQVMANLQRADVPDLDLAEKLAVLIVAQKWSQKFLAGQLGKSEATVTRLLQLNRLVGRVKELVRAGRLPATTASTMAGLPEADQLALAEQLAAGTLHHGGLAKAIRTKRPGRAGRKPISSARSFRFGTGRGEEIVVKASGELTPAGLIERLRSLIAASERAEKQGLGIRVVGDFLKAMTRPPNTGGPA